MGTGVSALGVSLVLVGVRGVVSLWPNEVGEGILENRLRRRLMLVEDIPACCSLVNV